MIRDGDLKASGILPQSERDMDRERLRHASLNRVASWGNTLEAARGAKEQKAKEAAEAYELMRQRQDDAEELFKGESRKVAIERARSLLFSQNEQVKCLESKYLLTSAMKEREMQIDLRNKVAERKRKEEEYWHKKMLEDQAKGLEEERKKEAGIKLRAQQAKAVQMAQLEEMRQAYVSMKIEEKEEGLLTKLQSQKAAQEAAALEEARQKAEKERTHTTQAENKRMLAEKAKKDAEDAKKEAEKMKFFAAEKERKMALRAERAAEINRIKQEMKQRMIDKQVAFLASLRTNEEQRLGDQIREADEKRKGMEDAKAAKLHEGFLAAKAFNAAQTAANNDAKVQLFQEDRRNAEVLKTKFKESMAEEAAKEEARRAKVKKLQQFHVRQIEEKKHRMALLQDETNDEIRDMEQQFAIQDAEFQDYAVKLVERVRSEGKNPLPIILQLQKNMRQSLAG